MDITKCKGTECPIRTGCKRYEALSHPTNQSWFIEVPGEWITIPHRDIEESVQWKCDMYWGKSQEGICNNLKKIVGL